MLCKLFYLVTSENEHLVILAHVVTRHWLPILLVCTVVLGLFGPIPFSLGDTGGNASTSTSIFSTSAAQSTLTTTFYTTIYSTTLTSSSRSPTTYSVTLSETIAIGTAQTTLYSISTATYVVIHEPNPIDPYLPIVAAIITALVTLIVPHLTVNSTSARQRREKRRETVYAPLYDELEQLKNAVEGNHFVTMEYDKIKGSHAMVSSGVPQSLQKKIQYLYEDLVPNLGHTLLELRRAHRAAILGEMINSVHVSQVDGVRYDPAADESISALATDLSQVILSSPPVGLLASLESAFRAFKQRSGLQQNTVTEYYDHLVGLFRQGPAFDALEEMRQVAIQTIEEIRQELAKELEIDRH